MNRGLLLMALQTGIVIVTGAKYWKDRAELPRAWALVQPVDPDLPIRGRYVRLGLYVETEYTGNGSLKLSVVNGRLQGAQADEDTGNTSFERLVDGRRRLNAPVAFFIPEHVPDPSRRAPGEELWAEVTVPRKGPPRPIRLAVKKGDAFTVLPLD